MLALREQGLVLAEVLRDLWYAAVVAMTTPYQNMLEDASESLADAIYVARNANDHAQATEAEKIFYSTLLLNHRHKVEERQRATGREDLERILRNAGVK